MIVKMHIYIWGFKNKKLVRILLIVFFVLYVIRNIGIGTLGHSGIYACGEGSIEPSLKQEKECLVSQAEATGLAPWSVTICIITGCLIWRTLS